MGGGGVVYFVEWDEALRSPVNPGLEFGIILWGQLAPLKQIEPVMSISFTL